MQQLQMRSCGVLTVRVCSTTRQRASQTGSGEGNSPGLSSKGQSLAAAGQQCVVTACIDFLQSETAWL